MILYKTESSSFGHTTLGIREINPAPDILVARFLTGYTSRMHTFFVNTDGGARGNPGPEGVGVVISDESGKTLKKISRAIGETTNNAAEYEGVLTALTELKKMIPQNRRAETELLFKLDSELVVKQLNGEYQVKDEPLQFLFMKIWNMRVAHFSHMTFAHVPREENRGADALVNEAIDTATRKLL